MVHKVTLPSIHMNGTSAKTLCEEIRKACSDLQMARMSLASMTVHSRDHYVKTDPDSYVKARNEQMARLDKIDAIYKELTDLYLGIRDQV